MKIISRFLLSLVVAFSLMGCVKESNAPIAAFSASETSIAMGDSVKFTDQSENEPTSWSWDFGDGITSTEQDPLHTYINPGTYSVSLSVSNDIGTDTEIKTDFLSVEPVGIKPVAEFTSSATECALNDSIQFTDSSENAPTNWSWDFGDGFSSTKQNPIHIYSVEGYYTVRLIAENPFGKDSVTKTDYITVSASGTISDIDGNIYKTIKLGNQVWMAENIKATHFPNGDAISVMDRLAWKDISFYTIAMCYYNDSIDNSNTYGALYNWKTAISVCPEGWHLPSDEDWKQLEMFVGMSQADADNHGTRGTNEGSKLQGNKLLWSDGVAKNDPDFGTSGFNALPAGYITRSGNYHDLGGRANFWTSTEDPDVFSDEMAYYRAMDSDFSNIYRHMSYRDQGYSVRCLKD